MGFISTKLWVAAAMVSFTFMANQAFGVTAAATADKAMDPIDHVTTGAASRAMADVQIRRIKTMILTKKTDQEADYERLEKLQKALRGER